MRKEASIFKLIRNISAFAVLSVCALASDLTDEEARPHAVLAIKNGGKWTALSNLYVRRREEFEG